MTTKKENKLVVYHSGDEETYYLVMPKEIDLEQDLYDWTRTDWGKKERHCQSLLRRGIAREAIPEIDLEFFNDH